MLPLVIDTSHYHEKEHHHHHHHHEHDEHCEHSHDDSCAHDHNHSHECSHGHHHHHHHSSLSEIISQLKIYFSKAFLEQLFQNAILIHKQTTLKQLLQYTYLLITTIILFQFASSFFFHNSLVIFLLCFHSLHIYFDYWITIVIHYFSTKLQEKNKTNQVYSYGMVERMEVILRFINLVFLHFVCFAFVMESTQRFIDPHPITMKHAWFVGLVSLIIIGIGDYYFANQVQLNPAVQNQLDWMQNISPMTSSTQQQLHQLWNKYTKNFGTSNAFGYGNSEFVSETKLKKQMLLKNELKQHLPSSVAVMLTTFLVEVTGYEPFDTIVAVALALWLFYSYLPRLVLSSTILLQTVPFTMKNTVAKLIREVSTVEGVLECQTVHIWSLNYRKNSLIGTLKVRIASQAEEQVVLSKVNALFSPYVSNLTVQIIKEDWNLFASSSSTSLEQHNHHHHEHHHHEHKEEHHHHHHDHQ